MTPLAARPHAPGRGGDGGRSANSVLAPEINTDTVSPPQACEALQLLSPPSCCGGARLADITWRCLESALSRACSWLFVSVLLGRRAGSYFRPARGPHLSGPRAERPPRRQKPAEQHGCLRRDPPRYNSCFAAAGVGYAHYGCAASTFPHLAPPCGPPPPLPPPPRYLLLAAPEYYVKYKMLSHALAMPPTPSAIPHHCGHTTAAFPEAVAACEFTCGDIGRWDQDGMRVAVSGGQNSWPQGRRPLGGGVRVQQLCETA